MNERKKEVNLNTEHPASCVVIQDLDHTMTYAHGIGELAVFSDEDLAKRFVTKKGLGVVALRTYSWDDLVEEYGERFTSCTIDHKGKSGFYPCAPLTR